MVAAKNDPELNFRRDGIIAVRVALTALQLQWELATRMTPVNELRPFRLKQEQPRREKEGGGKKIGRTKQITMQIKISLSYLRGWKIIENRK